MFWVFFLVLGGMSFFLAQYPILLVPFIILCFAAPLSMIFMATRGGNNANKLLQNGGVKTTAQITNVEDTGMTLNNINIGIRLTLMVASVTGSPFTAQVETFVSRVSIPRVGDAVEVVYNPDNTSQVAVVMS